MIYIIKLYDMYYTYLLLLAGHLRLIRVAGLNVVGIQYPARVLVCTLKI